MSVGFDGEIPCQTGYGEIERQFEAGGYYDGMRQYTVQDGICRIIKVEHIGDEELPMPVRKCRLVD